MPNEQPNNPLHGLTLAKIVTTLQEHYGWDGLAERINVNCFKSDPSLKSSLKFLRKTQWARTEVEELYLEDQWHIERNRKRNKRRAEMRAARTEPNEGEDPSEPE